MNWNKEDPRVVLVNRASANIIILRPALTGYNFVAGVGSITSENWKLLTDFVDYPIIDEWNSDWFWILAPEI